MRWICRFPSERATVFRSSGLDECDEMRVVVRTFHCWGAVDEARQKRDKRRLKASHHHSNSNAGSSIMTSERMLLGLGASGVGIGISGRTWGRRLSSGNRSPFIGEDGLERGNLRYHVMKNAVQTERPAISRKGAQRERATYLLRSNPRKSLYFTTQITNLDITSCCFSILSDPIAACQVYQRGNSDSSASPVNALLLQPRRTPAPEPIALYHCRLCHL